ncbi:MAG: ribonuclease J [Rhodospirillaceae bacterium]
MSEAATHPGGAELLFLPLGGAGEIGMNLNLYGYGPPDDETWLMVDLGVTFNDGALPGVDVITPDPAFIAERRDRLAALVLTHAHEDHIGAVPYLWPQLRCPIYATPFTVSVLKRKLAETDFADAVEIIEVPLGGRLVIGPFELELVTLTHSIPEPNAIVIRTPLGTVFHTGDWKFDPDPVVGEVADEATLRRIGEEGALAVVCDSTNVFTPGESGSEADILENLDEIIAARTGRVAVACFATNVARLETIATAAAKNGRDVVLAGRSLQRIVAAARENGYMSDVAAFLTEDDAGFLPDDKALIICTGSQGEPRAALARIAEGDQPRVALNAGDTLIFSSRVIPGNERAIGELQAKFLRRGIEVVTARDSMIHVSGHPARDELARMYQHLRPEIAVPVHGELRHLTEHAQLARDCQVPHAVVCENGAVVRLAPGAAGVINHVPAGRLAADGNRLVPVDSEVVKSRIRTMWNGFAVLTVVLDGARLAAEPQISTSGLVEDDDDPDLDAVRLAVQETIDRLLPDAGGADDDAVAEEVRIAARRAFRALFDKRTVTRVHLVRRNGTTGE